MMRRRHRLVLAIYLSKRGFAFVLFEGPFAPVDWGAKEVRERPKNQRSLVAISAVLQRYRPSMLVLQDTALDGTRRTARVRELNACIAELAEEQSIPVHAYSRAQVRQAFNPYGHGNKHTMAEAIVKRIPALERYLPPPRKPWMSEDSRMSLFDAAALALMFFSENTDVS